MFMFVGGVVVVWWWCGGGVVVVWWWCGGGVVGFIKLKMFLGWNWEISFVFDLRNYLFGYWLLSFICCLTFDII
jgi:hypothetical protein